MATDYPNTSKSYAVSEGSIDATPVEAVVSAVADATGQSPLEMTPLAEVVDPDSLNSLFKNSAGETSLVITFEYCNHQVTVSPDGVQVGPLISSET